MSTDTLTVTERRAAQKFADVLKNANPVHGVDKRGLLLAELAQQMQSRGQFYTARLLQRAADTYEGKR